jgi:hypothetical protein
MTKAKDMINPVHAEHWLKIAKDVKKVLDDLDTTTKRSVAAIMTDLNKRLESTGYEIISDYSDRYRYFDFDVFTKDREYGIRIFLGSTWFDNIHLHNLTDMYLYAPSDIDDVLDDVTIEELERNIRS